MEKRERLTTSERLEGAGGGDRLDIQPGAELSPALRRLVEEVRMEATTESVPGTRYDRVHNRHNRG